MIKHALLFTAVSGLLIACKPAPDDKKTELKPVPKMTLNRLQALPIEAPKAKTVLHEAEYHGIKYSDPYHWLKDQSYPVIDDEEVLSYLNEENDYYQAFLKPNEELKNTLFEEFKGRVDEQEVSVPWTENGYEYSWFYEPGQNYRNWQRRNLTTGETEVFLNESSLAKDHEYFVLSDWAVSPDNRLLAYTVDTEGDEKYQLFIKDMKTGLMLGDTLSNVSGDVTFSADSNAVIYGQLQKDRWRTESIKMHILGTDVSKDKILFADPDDGYFLSFYYTSSKEFLVLSASQAEVTELHVLPANNLNSKPVLLASRDREFSYSADHAHGKFYIIANDTHVNSRLATVEDKAPAYGNWQTLIAGSDDFYLQDIQTFESTMIMKGRVQGEDQIILFDYDGKQESVPFPEDVFSASIGTNSEFTQSYTRINYRSMVTPDSVYDVDLKTKELTLRKQDKIPSGYDKSQYESKRIMAPARDGVMVPVTIVYKKGFKQDGSQPLFLYGYGAYGSTVSPRFSTMRLSLLDRGFAFAIAHVRGSDMMGYQWYLDGKLEKRENTFNDFVDVARHLVNENYVQEGNISISGRSAGGELMGAVVLQAPELWRSVILGVPFVDVLNTMLDATLPLTPPEWQEWGNPIESQNYFEIIKSYSPYDNILQREYPPMLVTGGLHDPRVTYWEPAKWTARMRANKTDNNLLIMRMNMGAGHFANSGRYGRLKDYAEEYAFTLLAHEISE
ncbi:MAG: S9 family peptidase [Gammaproteobacteria bacterium]|nr:S9 family peptidase [Gammaproteobacteria bacterium]